MKLRIRGDSLRLRLTRAEVATLGGGGCVSETVHFSPESRLVYAIELDAAERVGATFEGARVRVGVPRAIAERWASSEEVGFEGAQENGGGTLRILVEKDFACLAPREENEDSEAFPNPKAC